MEGWLTALLDWLALPRVGLPAVFVVSFVSATLLPLGSEPVVFGYVKLNPDMMWPTIFVATAGNTLGGMVDYWIGLGAKAAVERRQQTHPPKHDRAHLKAIDWLERFGPKAMLLAWLPAVGDPLCAVAGWLRMPFWPCAAYMLVGKFLRYAFYTPLLLGLFPG